MAEGVRKRGKTWSYYFDTAKINGERKKIEKGGFRTQKEALDARAAAIAQYNNVGRTFSPKEISVWQCIVSLALSAAPVCQAHDKKFITFFAVFRAAS